MKLKAITLMLLGGAISLPPVLADDSSELKAQLKAMQQQMQIMQAKLDAQEAAIKKQDQAANELKHQQAPGHTGSNTVTRQVADSLSVGGLIEVIANQTDSGGWTAESASDIVLDTLELAIEASAGEWLSGQALFLYEDADDDNLAVDEAYITVANSDETSFYASAGRLYVPFGAFTSNMISDPATLTLGEAREEVVQIGFETETGFYGSAYVFNGDADEANSNYGRVDNNHIDNYGLNFGYALENDAFSLDTGVGYINNIATSDSLQDAVDNNGLCAGDGCIDNYVAGLSLHAIATIGQFNIIGEYIMALDDFKANELSPVNNDELKPQAWNIEGAYLFELAGKEAKLALGYQKTKDMYLDIETTDYFEKAWLASISLDIAKNTRLMAEWRHAVAYNEVKAASGSDFDDEDLFQLKLSYGF